MVKEQKKIPSMKIGSTQYDYYLTTQENAQYCLPKKSHYTLLFGSNCIRRLHKNCSYLVPQEACAIKNRKDCSTRKP